MVQPLSFKWIFQNTKELKSCWLGGQGQGRRYLDDGCLPTLVFGACFLDHRHLAVTYTTVHTTVKRGLRTWTFGGLNC